MYVIALMYKLNKTVITKRERSTINTRVGNVKKLLCGSNTKLHTYSKPDNVNHLWIKKTVQRETLVE